MLNIFLLAHPNSPGGIKPPTTASLILTVIFYKQQRMRMRMPGQFSMHPFLYKAGSRADSIITLLLPAWLWGQNANNPAPWLLPL